VPTAPLSSAGDDFARRLDRLGSTVRKAQRPAVTSAALAAKKAQLEVMRTDTGGDLRLSGVGRRGARVGVRFFVQGDREALVRATGPVHFVAHPMSPHRIPRQRSARGRRRYVIVPGADRGGVRSSAQHPGTRGKNTWRRGRRKASVAVENEVVEKMGKAIAQGFKG